jgi:hypothetical protein
MSEPVSQADADRRDRGEQLRALVVSWDEGKTFLLALNEQQREIEEGRFELNDGWYVMADEILGTYLSRPQMKWDEKKEEPKDEGPKIIIP